MCGEIQWKRTFPEQSPTQTRHFPEAASLTYARTVITTPRIARCQKRETTQNYRHVTRRTYTRKLRLATKTTFAAVGRAKANKTRVIATASPCIALSPRPPNPRSTNLLLSCLFSLHKVLLPLSSPKQTKTKHKGQSAEFLVRNTTHN